MVFSSGFQSERWDGVAAVSGAAAARPADGRRNPASRPLPLTLIQHYRAEYTEVYEERIYALKCGLPEAIGQFLTGGPGRVPAGLPPRGFRIRCLLFISGVVRRTSYTMRVRE